MIQRAVLQGFLELPIEHKSGENWKYDRVARNVSYGYEAIKRA